MKKARVKAIVELDMFVPDGTPSGMPKNEEETNRLRAVCTLFRQYSFLSSNAQTNIVSVEEIT